ncbi:MAG: NTP transferase domain-containing protein [Armatimonadetes bacterium]|nr:NTP transferase domain-containing protein [Armatimonadota bacterium]
MPAEKPKAAVTVGGSAMAERVVDAMRQAGAGRVIVIVGHRADSVKSAIRNSVEYVVQEEQLGTGHAVGCARGAIDGCPGPILVAYADLPLVRACDVEALIAHHRRTGAAATLLTAVFSNPGSLGRILRGTDGCVRAIVEARDATEQELAVREINVGVYCFNAPLLFASLAKVTNDNAKGEYYLTDVVSILVRESHRVEAMPMEDAEAGMGVDTPEDLARARRILERHGSPT